MGFTPTHILQLTNLLARLKACISFGSLSDRQAVFPFSDMTQPLDSSVERRTRRHTNVMITAFVSAATGNSAKEVTMATSTTSLHVQFRYVCLVKT